MRIKKDIIIYMDSDLIQIKFHIYLYYVILTITCDFFPRIVKLVNVA